VQWLIIHRADELLRKMILVEKFNHISRTEDKDGMDSSACLICLFADS
jgi:hypothetical protein